MSEINYLAVVVSAVAAFVVSTVWYIVFLSSSTTDTVNIPTWKKFGEVARSLVVAYVLAYLVVRLDVDNWIDALQLGFGMWIGFPAMLFAGSFMWQLPPITGRLAAIHAGDWLAKLLVMAVILSVWR